MTRTDAEDGDAKVPKGSSEHAGSGSAGSRNARLQPGLADSRSRPEAAILHDRRERLSNAKRDERQLVRLAFASLLAGAVAILLAADDVIPLPWWAFALALVAAMIALVAARESATRRRRRSEHAVRFWERALARLEDDWDFGQDDGESYSDPEHPYASDLDVFGPDSVFQRLNATHTAIGRDRLAAMLKGDVPAGTTAERQEAVRELLEERTWREEFEIELSELRLRGGQSAVERELIDERTRALLAWGDAPVHERPPGWQVVGAFLLAALATGSIVAAVAGFVPWSLILPFYILNFVVLSRIPHVHELIDDFESIDEALEAWAKVMAAIERRQPRARLLAERHATLASGSRSASAAIQRLHVLVERLSRRRNHFWALTFDVLFLYDFHASRRLFDWKREHGPHLRPWLGVTADFEALASLAAYADACPDDVWPEEREDAPTLFDARHLAHPLLSRKGRVGNDIVLPELPSVLLVTGSNMSGKSTLLRASGLALVFSHMGLPVPAASLRHRPLGVVTCMRVHDSIARGSSRFHAEVQRLRACVEWASSGRPTLALLDEILAGTNSADRHAGALAVLRLLVERKAATMVATHDLQLVSLADEFPGQVEIVHFRDLLHDGQMAFDYLMRPGPCPSSNALRILTAMVPGLRAER